MLAWSMIKSASIVLIFLKVLIITRSEREITNLRNFINSDRVSSGDEAYDKLQERNYKRTARTMLRIIYGIILFDSLVLSVPCDANKKILELPSLLISCEKHVKPVLYFCCSSLIPLGFLTRLLSNIACVGTIFMGMQAKCMVLTQRYGLILKRNFSSSACDFQRMNRELRMAFIQHQEYLRFLYTNIYYVELLFQHFFKFQSFKTTKVLGSENTFPDSLLLRCVHRCIVLHYKKHRNKLSLRLRRGHHNYHAAGISVLVPHGRHPTRSGMYNQ